MNNIHYIIYLISKNIRSEKNVINKNTESELDFSKTLWFSDDDLDTIF